MNQRQLTELIRSKGSFLCVGLDPDMSRIPAPYSDADDSLFEFNKMVIDATRDHCVAYKPNTAFFEAHGASGWLSLEKTIRYIGSSHFVIADAKRGDIGNTANMYAEAFFKELDVDAITLSPYMGHDSVSPYLKYPDKWAIILVKTSNTGSSDFQTLVTENDSPLYIDVLRKCLTWGDIDNTMFVVGANNLSELKGIREIAPDHFFLVPGFGAQGGQLKDIQPYLSSDTVGILANYSRQVIYAGDFAQINEAAAAIHRQMREMLKTL
ncbi:MAG TPA: orotidine-5'-phosphate decarboxylase [Saprospiraceae bacterium]|nr:orotidine-5'-phosphate decarboxylase [Saprospiraceae bacterium]HRP83870.1 orotidine-5'-phosphate decarboxylase [Saprospiraceae bacterium]